MESLTRAREAYDAAVIARDQAIEALETAEEGVELEPLIEVSETTQAEVERTAAVVERFERVIEGRDNSPKLPEPKVVKEEPFLAATARGELKHESAYRPDKAKTGEISFLRDQLAARHGDAEARERLTQNRREAMEIHGWEERDMANASTTGAEFLPPLYLSDLFILPNTAGRNFADALPKYPLPPLGTAISIPKLSSGVTAAARSDGGTVSETDGVTATVSHVINEIAGQVDIGRQAVMRSEPGLDVVIGRQLVRRYNAYLDTQLLSGSGTAPQHVGLDNVTSPNTEAYTDASPTAAELVPKIFEAISKIASNRLEEMANLIVIHPRRAAWLASNLSSTFPLFQLGSYVQAAGSQDGGFVNNFAGLRVVMDPNILTTYGASTNEDQIYVLVDNDFLLAEGPLFSRVFEDVGSGTGVIRYQVFANSAFLSQRYPKGLTIISGTGLVTPTF